MCKLEFQPILFFSSHIINFIFIMVLWVKTPSGKLSYPLAGILLDLHQENFRIWTSLNKICEITLASPLLSDQDLLKESCLIGPWWKRIWWWLGVFGERGLLNKGWVKKQGLALTLNYVNPDDICDLTYRNVRPHFKNLKYRRFTIEYD